MYDAIYKTDSENVNFLVIEGVPHKISNRQKEIFEMVNREYNKSAFVENLIERFYNDGHYIDATNIVQTEKSLKQLKDYFYKEINDLTEEIEGEFNVEINKQIRKDMVISLGFLENEEMYFL